MHTRVAETRCESVRARWWMKSAEFTSNMHCRNIKSKIPQKVSSAMSECEFDEVQKEYEISVDGRIRPKWNSMTRPGASLGCLPTDCIMHVALSFSRWLQKATSAFWQIVVGFLRVARAHTENVIAVTCHCPCMETALCWERCTFYRIGCTARGGQAASNQKVLLAS